MNTIDIVIEGYAKITPKGWDATGTTTLITTDIGKKILVDPGANRDLLFEELKKRNLSLESIDMVFLTHHHLDHAMNVGLFPNAKIIDEEAVYTQSVAIEGVKMLPDTDITVMATPGHEYAHAVLIVPTEKGTVVVAGDNFWWPSSAKATEGQDYDLANKEKLINRSDDFAQNLDELIASRKMILDIADWIIPGHGKMFPNKR